MSVRGPDDGTIAFVDELFQNVESVFCSRVTRPKLMCEIFHCFQKPGKRRHNCLGCNLSDSMDHIATFLRVHNTTEERLYVHHVYCDYFVLLNSVWERIRDVFNIIKYTEELTCRYFSDFIKVRRWANFFKHPREFGWMVHHPIYVIEGVPGFESLEAIKDEAVLIDDAFVKRYYAKECAKGLAKKFQDPCTPVYVALPNCLAVTEGVCSSLEKLVEVVTENKAYQEMLEDRTTIEGYFSAKRGLVCS